MTLAPHANPVSSTIRATDLATNRHEKTKILLDRLLTHRSAIREIMESRLGKWPPPKLFDGRVSNPSFDEAEALLKEFPTRTVLIDWEKGLDQAINATADDNLILILLSVMLEGFPKNTVTSPEGYIRAMTVSLQGRTMSPYLLAYAISNIWQMNKFPPPVIDFVSEYDKARDTAKTIYERVRKARMLRENIETKFKRFDKSETKKTSNVET
jgi:hypothetical protein